MLLQKAFSNRGFTIVELLIVIVVIGILAAISVVAYRGISERAEYSSMQSDMSSILKAIEVYKVDNGGYPNSADCVNADGKYNYQYSWCGWDQGTGESFIPGLSPNPMQSIPNRPDEKQRNDTYLYQSRAANCSSSGTDAYQLIRYRPDGLSDAEMSDNPNLMTGSGYDGIAWGYRSSGCTSWW